MYERSRLPRRRFVAGCTLTAMVANIKLTAAEDRVAQFRSISARLTGFPDGAIDPYLARSLMDGLNATGAGPALDRLLAGATVEFDGDLGRRIALAWYSGIHPAVDGQEVSTYEDALIWQALNFTQPPGTCGVEPGDWSLPPTVTGTGQ